MNRKKSKSPNEKQILFEAKDVMDQDNMMLMENTVQAHFEQSMGSKDVQLLDPNELEAELKELEARSSQVNSDLSRAQLSNPAHQS